MAEATTQLKQINQVAARCIAPETLGLKNEISMVRQRLIGHARDHVLPEKKGTGLASRRYCDRTLRYQRAVGHLWEVGGSPQAQSEARGRGMICGQARPPPDTTRGVAGAR
jgi:hypothetical protein